VSIFNKDNKRPLLSAIAQWVTTEQQYRYSWYVKEDQTIRLSSLNEIWKFLGLKCFSNLEINFDTFNNCKFGKGIKSIYPNNSFASVIVQVGTCSFNKKTKEYVSGVFNILVMMGIGVIVWYNFIPVGSDPFPIPVSSMPPDAYETFLNPFADVEGYKKINLFITNNDFLDRVISVYRLQSPFNDILPPHEYPIEEDPLQKHRYACIGTAIIVASFIAANGVIPGLHV